MFTVPSGWPTERATLLAVARYSPALLKLEVPDVAVSDVAAGCVPVEADDSFVGCPEDAGDVSAGCGWSVTVESEFVSVAGCVEVADSVVVVAGDSVAPPVEADDSGCVAPEGASPEPCPIAVLPLSIVVPSLRPFDKFSLS